MCGVLPFINIYQPLARATNANYERMLSMSSCKADHLFKLPLMIMVMDSKVLISFILQLYTLSKISSEGSLQGND